MCKHNISCTHARPSQTHVYRFLYYYCRTTKSITIPENSLAQNIKRTFGLGKRCVCICAKIWQHVCDAVAQLQSIYALVVIMCVFFTLKRIIVIHSRHRNWRCIVRTDAATYPKRIARPRTIPSAAGTHCIADSCKPPLPMANGTSDNRDGQSHLTFRTALGASATIITARTNKWYRVVK